MRILSAGKWEAGLVGAGWEGLGSTATGAEGRWDSVFVHLSVWGSVVSQHLLTCLGIVVSQAHTGKAR